MIIHIAKGIGQGPTKLSAFDAALNDAGVANFNLIKLSSVIPTGSEIVIHKKAIPKEVIKGGWGDKLFVVMAEERENSPNVEAWAGIGWVQDVKTGEGLFVEHEGASEQSVRRDITQSLEALMATRNIDFGEIHMEVNGGVCNHHPVSSLVVAVFQSEPWQK